ncbi:16S rRNA (guanine(527)-N(7))-methyltransferase RsmG [Methylomarinum sp. Ch1-1]|uniref:Ribosomal RNA small subunit methyltransferase G n=1 Tax=Methylomarinum roseum TaxID=3067653 RepID=A0AAU7NVY9_9GAMM|nr:16S rRNA (guanine(527)-N(7))-methyltransferase RsmG [Methylomarinum sp. Ch1-1]MDP4522785.1 16S rRNA (guanine(527)-N(7))-methyltransferase RsmG [Methylomarinum sp. Ch1-1]
MDKCRHILRQGLQQLALPVDEEKIDRLLAFIKLIGKWNKAYNLTAVRDEREMATLHILDSLAILPYVQGSRVADIGTGAGLPGIPLAIFLPQVEFTLVDSNSKKTRFVQQAILELKLKNVTVKHSRVEQFTPSERFSTVIMRAFASLETIINLTRHLLAEEAVLLAMKGQNPEQELMQLTEKYTVIPIDVPGIAAERCLVRIERQSKHG